MKMDEYNSFVHLLQLLTTNGDFLLLYTFLKIQDAIFITKFTETMFYQPGS